MAINDKMRAIMSFDTAINSKIWFLEAGSKSELKSGTDVFHKFHTSPSSFFQ